MRVATSASRPRRATIQRVSIPDAHRKCRLNTRNCSHFHSARIRSCTRKSVVTKCSCNVGDRVTFHWRARRRRIRVCAADSWMRVTFLVGVRFSVARFQTLQEVNNERDPKWNERTNVTHVRILEFSLTWMRERTCRTLRERDRSSARGVGGCAETWEGDRGGGERERAKRASQWARNTRTAVRRAQLYLCLVVVRIMRRWVNCQVKSEMAANEQQRKVSERRTGSRGRGRDPFRRRRRRRGKISGNDEVSRDRTSSGRDAQAAPRLLCQKSRLIRRSPPPSRVFYTYVCTSCAILTGDRDECVIRGRRTIPGITRGTNVPRARRIPG